MEIKYSIVAVLLLIDITRISIATLTEDDEVEFRKVPWLNWRQAMDAYKVEHQAAKRLGKNTPENPNRLKFYPENRVLINGTVVLFCLLTPDKVNGYRANSISLQILQEGYTHRRSLLAPIRKLLNHADQLNCWNYAQESVCQPLRDCNNPSQMGLRTVGIVTKEGWGVFQLRAGKLTQAHYQCISEMQSVLSFEERSERSQKEYVTVGSDVEQLLVFDSPIGEPTLNFSKPDGFPRGQPLSAQCRVSNSHPGSQFTIELALMRPPPAGVPGANRPELLASRDVLAEQPNGLLDWTGEAALLSHHGLKVLCSIRKDWGHRKGLRVVGKHLQVQYMFPVFLHNPRIKEEMSSLRVKSMEENYYKSPKEINLRQAEYVVCKSDGYPAPEVSWHTGAKKAVWILNETMFISKWARVGVSFVAMCRGENKILNLMDSIEVRIKVMSGAQSLIPAGHYYASVAAFCLFIIHAI